MTIKRTMKFTVLMLAALSANVASAYTEEKEKPVCKAPKIRDFNLPVYSAEDKVEVPPESELMFTISNWTNPETIKVTAKGLPLETNIENKNSFFRVTAKLPAALNGKFARINVMANAVLGCKGEGGWLVKVADGQAPVPSSDAEIAKEKTSAETVEKAEDIKTEDVAGKTAE